MFSDDTSQAKGFNRVHAAMQVFLTLIYLDKCYLSSFHYNTYIVCTFRDGKVYTLGNR